MKMHRFSATFFETDASGNSKPRFEAGKDYVPDAESQRCIARGIAEEVDVPDPEPAAETAAAPEAAAEAVAEEPAPAPAPAAKSKK